MTVTLELPDDIARTLTEQSGDLSRRVLECLAVDGYRQEILTQMQVGKFLGVSRVETEDSSLDMLTSITTIRLS